MLADKITNSLDFTEEEKTRLIKLLQKEELTDFADFPTEYRVDIGYDEGYEEAVHLVKLNPGGIAEVEDAKYILIMVKDGENIVVDGADIPNAFKVDNTDEMKHYLSLDAA